MKTVLYQVPDAFYDSAQKLLRKAEPCAIFAASPGNEIRAGVKS